jgi:hypothetical protein
MRATGAAIFGKALSGRHLMPAEWLLSEIKQTIARLLDRQFYDYPA